LKKCTVGVPVGWFFGSFKEGVGQQKLKIPRFFIWGFSLSMMQ
jgi:hypothetical protein